MRYVYLFAWAIVMMLYSVRWHEVMEPWSFFITMIVTLGVISEVKDDES